MTERLNGCSTVLTLSKESVCGLPVNFSAGHEFYFHDYSPQGLSLTTASNPDACLFLGRTFVTGATVSAGSFGGSLPHKAMCIPIYAAFGKQSEALYDFVDGDGGVTISVDEVVESWTLREFQDGCATGSQYPGTQITGFDFSSSLGSFTTMTFPFQGAKPTPGIAFTPVINKPVPTEFFNDSTTKINIADATVGIPKLLWPEETGGGVETECDYIDISFSLAREVNAAPECRGSDTDVGGCDNVSGGKLTGTLTMYMACEEGLTDMEKYVNGINTYQIDVQCEDAAGGKLDFTIFHAAWTSITPTWEQNGSRTYEMAFEGSVGTDFSGTTELLSVTHTKP